MTTDYKFTPEQEAWLRDLETTEEPQTKGYLHRIIPAQGYDAGYCCLGRACVVLEVEESFLGEIGFFNGRDNVLTNATVTKLGLRDECGSFDESVDGSENFEDGYDSLVEMNDDGKTFKEIASYIRDNPENVFLQPWENQ